MPLFEAMFSQPVGFKSPDLNIMCTNTSTYLVVKIKSKIYIVLECGRILQTEPKVASATEDYKLVVRLQMQDTLGIVVIDECLFR